MAKHAEDFDFGETLGKGAFGDVSLLFPFVHAAFIHPNTGSLCHHVGCRSY